VGCGEACDSFGVMLMYALVDCNNFYASCERVFDPTLRARPVVILSNNDGCIIARSEEAKAVGFPMGGPIFQYDALIKKAGVSVLSSNYALYGDMSRRVMTVLRLFAPQSEVYSIDESFLYWREAPPALAAYGARIRETVGQWTGVPVSVGFGSTKTLAKSASKLAKKNGGVYWLRSEDEETLRSLPASSVWGVGSRSTKKLAACGIHTVYDLQQANDEHIRRLMSVTGQRTVLELRGMPCIELEEVRPNKRELCCSRSFGRMLSERSELREAVATFVTRAAEKLRSSQSVSRCVHVFLETNGHRQDLEQYANAATLRLPVATAYTPMLLEAAMTCLEDVFREGYRYKRAGVLLLDVCAGDAVQQDLFTADDMRPAHTRLMNSLDHINKRFGRNTLAPAAIGIRNAHRMNQQHLSPCYTTRWDEVITVRL
jgi:DNA polymerase V